MEMVGTNTLNAIQRKPNDVQHRPRTAHLPQNQTASQAAVSTSVVESNTGGGHVQDSSNKVELTSDRHCSPIPQLESRIRKQASVSPPTAEGGDTSGINPKGIHPLKGRLLAYPSDPAVSSKVQSQSKQLPMKSNVVSPYARKKAKSQKKQVSFQSTQDQVVTNLSIQQSLIPKPMQASSSIQTLPKQSPYSFALMKSKVGGKSPKHSFNKQGQKKRCAVLPKRPRENSPADPRGNQSVEVRGQHLFTHGGKQICRTGLSKSPLTCSGSQDTDEGNKHSLSVGAAKVSHDKLMTTIKEVADGQPDTKQACSTHDTPHKGQNNDQQILSSASKRKRIAHEIKRSTEETPVKSLHSVVVMKTRPSRLNYERTAQPEGSSPLTVVRPVQFVPLQDQAALPLRTDKSPIKEVQLDSNKQASQDTLLQRTVKSVKQKVADQKKTMSLPGLQPDPRQVRRRRKQGTEIGESSRESPFELFSYTSLE